jgi:two-component system chemotaxis sensor kinase CheA
MSVGVGPETYIIPLGYVMESMQPERGMMKSVSGVERLIQVRGEYLPVVCLHEVFESRVRLPTGRRGSWWCLRQMARVQRCSSTN